MKMPPVQPGTGPLTAIPLRTAPITPGSEPGKVPAPETAPESGNPPAGSQVDTQVDAVSSAAFAPDAGIRMPDVSAMPEAQRNLTTSVATLLDGKEMTPVCRQQLEGLAKTLGFRNLDMMQHHLRYLSGPQKQQLLSQLATNLSTTDNSDAAVKQTFQTAFHGAIDQLFTANPKLPGRSFPPPIFSASEHPLGDASWDTAALASVYNGLSSILEDSPQRFAVIANGGPPKADGSPGPMEFVRRQSPSVDPKASIFDKMSQAVMIAHTDCDNCHVYLYDTAIKGDNKEIVDGVVGKLDMLSRMDPNTKDLIPQYTAQETRERDLGQKKGETDADYNLRMRQRLTGDYLTQFGAGQPKNLTDAINFVIRYKGLNDPAIVDPPIPLVDPDGRPDSAGVQESLRRMGPSNMARVMARMEQADAVGQMQGFLKATLPNSNQLAVDGLMGPQTRTMAHAFQASVALNTLKERIEDDDSLSETRKGELLGKLNDEFAKLGKSPNQAGSILKRVSQQVRQLVNEQPSPLGSYTRQALLNDLGQLQNLTSSATFNHSTAEYLVNNWLNVMDSGKGLDTGEQLVVHESGHIWEHQMDKTGSLEVGENWSRLFDDSNKPAAEGGTDMYNTNTQDFRDRLHSDRAAASDYGASSAQEDFAEASRIFTYDPQRLMRRSLMKFLYVNAINGNTYKPDQIMRMAGECGYSTQDLKDRLSAFLGQGNNQARFTLKMSDMLAKTYAPLQHELNHTTAPELTPVAPGLTFNLTPPGVQPPRLTSPSLSLNPPLMPEPGNAPAESRFELMNPVSLRWPGPEQPSPMWQLYQSPTPASPAAKPTVAPPATPDQPGWMLEHLSEAYTSLSTQLKQPNLSEEDSKRLHAQLKQLIDDFVTQGPAAITAPQDLGPGAASFDAALKSPQLGYGDDKAVQGRALVAAMAIYRATGSFDSSRYPELARQLPPAFDSLQSESNFQSMMRPNSKFDSSLLLNGSLERIRWYERNQDGMQQSLSDANSRAEDIDGEISGVLDQAAVSRELVGLMQDDKVQGVFSDHELDLRLIRTSLNDLITTLNRTTGAQYAPISADAVKMYLLTLNANGAHQINPGNLEAFLRQRDQGLLPGMDAVSSG